MITAPTFGKPLDRIVSLNMTDSHQSLSIRFVISLIEIIKSKVKCVFPVSKRKWPWCSGKILLCRSGLYVFVTFNVSSTKLFKSRALMPKYSFIFCDSIAEILVNFLALFGGTDNAAFYPRKSEEEPNGASI